MYKVNKQKCAGCQVCLQNCPDAIKMGTDGKAEIVDQEKIEQCGGTNVCPFGAIEKISGDSNNDNNEENNPSDESVGISQFGGRGMGRGLGRGMGRGLGMGRGRGLGLGSRDGRGMGMGRGRR